MRTLDKLHDVTLDGLNGMGLPSAAVAKERLRWIVGYDRMWAPAWVWRPTTRAMSGFHVECRDAGYDRRGRRIIERLAWPKPRYRLERRR